MSRRLLAGVVCTFGLGLLMAQACFAQVNNEADATLLFKLANQEREKAGSRPLRWSDELAKAALLHTQRMVKKGGLSHRFAGEPDLGVRLADAGSHFDAYAENVGFALNAEEVHVGWMHSPGHRENLLNPSYSYVGIAVVRNGNRIYATQDFANLVTGVNPADATEIVRKILLKRGLREAHEISVEEMRRAACSGNEPKIPNVHGSVVIAHYTTNHPNELPEGLRKQLLGKSQAFSIGACEVTEPEHHMTTQAFTVVLFQ